MSFGGNETRQKSCTKQLIEKIEAQELDIVALHSLLRRVR